MAELAPTVGIAAACRALGVPRSAVYRTAHPAPTAAPRRRPARALTPDEVAHVRTVLNSDRFADCTPRQIYATLLDEGTYLCHWRTMYRILAAHREVRERRNQLRHPTYAAPELLATGPNQLWSWDITKFKGPTTWSYFYAYVILDVFSRCIVGWMVMERESAALAEQCIAETYHREGIQPNQLTLHADNGSAMTAKPVAQLLADLGVTKTHSRPHVSNDNPYSEAQFKTTKYRPDFPDRFGSLIDARAWMRVFVQWYNHDHCHSGIGLLPPAVVHRGQATAMTTARQQVLATAYAAHPERFVRGTPRPPRVPEAVWINRPVGPVDPSIAAVLRE
ncbi:IS3 family transposase ISAnsp11 [Herpetosiphon gulosus]|uniref:IS3 family transposase ISAnsp11 n=1 Tax=Herpetosiphon gulosus TaxID=1973496 RepID=A0ABP9X7B4_9CHLR